VRSSQPRLTGWSEPTGWAAAVSLAGVLGASWWWLLFLPLGDSHDGRINGRLGIHVRSFLELGPFDSGFGSSLGPLADGAYAHHPPALNGIQIFVGWVMGAGEWQLHLIGWLAGMATVLLIVAIMRIVGIGWPAALTATVLTAATPMFWIYARLGLGMAPGLVLVLLASRSRVTQKEAASWPLRIATFVAVLTSWPNGLLAVVVALWMARRHRRVALEMAGAGVVAAVAVGIWILQGTDVGELAGHVEARISAPVGLAGFVDQYRFFYTSLFPSWYLWLLLPALAAGFASRATRPVVAMLFGVGLAWTLALPEAAYVHDYWTYPLLGPVTIGLGALIGWATGGVRWRQILLPAALVLLGGLSFISLQTGPYPEAYFTAPAEAGRLLRSTEPAPGQQIGYVAGPISLPRWMSYYWDVDVVQLDEASLSRARPEDLVLVRLDLLPDWVEVVEPADVIAQSGRYVLVTAATLRS
jgi:4-amino-4-deoxy-L-arabinose transferase-like glycosyltransferase